MTIRTRNDKHRTTTEKRIRHKTPPVLCYVCKKPIQELEKLMELLKSGSQEEGLYKMQTIVKENIVRIITKDGWIFRHAETCKPGSPQYMKNKALADSFNRTLGVK